MAELHSTTLKAKENRAIYRAIKIIESRFKVSGLRLSSPNDAKAYIMLNLAPYDREVFMVLFMDVQNRLIECEKLFFGTLKEVSAHPREVVKSALKLNAASVILSHNHPSGSPNPSRADKELTRVLKKTLATIDVNVLDHIIIGGAESYSFAENGDI